MSYFLVKIAVIIATATSNITPQMRKIAKSKKIEAKISPIRYEPPTAANFRLTTIHLLSKLNAQLPCEPGQELPDDHACTENA